MQTRWPIALVMGCLIGSAGCASNASTASPSPSSGGAGAAADAGNSTPTPPTDAVAEEDIGPQVDAGAQAGDGAQEDTGGLADAGGQADSNAPLDAGSATTDAGAVLDTSALLDVATGSDVAGPVDAGKSDAGSPDSAATDASSTIDANTTTDAGTADAGAPVAVDPTKAGPFATAVLDATFTNPATGNKLPVHAVYPTTGAGPFPAVVIAHGFQLPPSQYYSYATRLASYGYVAFTVDYPTSLTGNDNPEQASDLSAGLDWAATQPQWAGKIDVKQAGVTGHSLGGKLALLAATLDKRFAAVFAIDPVDGGNSLLGCNLPKCVLVAKELGKLTIATAFVGETTDAKAVLQACAPAAQNFETLFAAAPSPSFAVTVAGANHMSFLDDVASCGFTCSFCNPAKVSAKAVGDLTKSFMVAYFERRLRNNAAYDTWLTGDAAKQAYISTGQATLKTK